MLASAILDRLVHHSNIVNILGNSYRMATALSKISYKNIGTIIQNNLDINIQQMIVNYVHIQFDKFRCEEQ